AQPDWARTSPRDRADILRRAFDLVQERADELARIMTLEMGKPLAEARGEVAYGAEFLRWFSEEATRARGGHRMAPDGRSRLQTHTRPVGPCLLITPWNFPLAMAARKVAPAIAAGCTMVLKPSELTPLTSLWLARVLQEAGLPDGVLNVVTTSAAGEVVAPLLADARLRKLSFTGSTPVGRELLRGAASTVMRTSMELGGNAPFLVFEDADLESAVAGAVVAKLRNMGQACTAANRFLVHESVAERFGELLAAEMDGLTLGDGTDPATDIGPLIDRRSRDRVAGLVDGALAAGARSLTTRRDVPSPGWFVRPTLLADVTHDSPVLRDEVFGPVAAIVTFRDEAEAVALANDTDMGLAGYVYTRDHARVQRMSEALEVGMLGANTGIVSNPAAPFGGVKQSGLGREGGDEGLSEYLETHYVAHADPW
ncbi:NAD-dependent succinate-semialdehyde dehydrogenase, partial [Aeromicrobium sp.]|uniref:NAD-dependent succinate-semialdehyde dehydrogenase n=1 Tax=Aeromicrobium sp. TaxID=1871063 RepID=UPI0028AF2308